MLTKIRELVKLVKRENGQGLTEYGLIIALVSVALVGALTLLALGISGVFDDVIAAF